MGLRLTHCYKNDITLQNSNHQAGWCHLASNIGLKTTRINVITDPPQNSMFLEFACFDILTGRVAVTSCDRIELCANRRVGGVTPSLNDFSDLRLSCIGLPIYVMIRPRGGDFLYSADELDQIGRDLMAFKSPDSGAGADGFVFGILDKDKRVDKARCSALVGIAGDKPCTFHRAFDLIPPQEMESQLEIVIECGFKAVLTSGGASEAMGGKDMLAKLVKAAKGRIQIIVGGGVRLSNLKMLMETGAVWFHSSGIADTSDSASLEEMTRMRETLR